MQEITTNDQQPFIPKKVTPDMYGSGLSHSAAAVQGSKVTMMARLGYTLERRELEENNMSI
jgi:hypothetical protein